MHSLPNPSSHLLTGLLKSESPLLREIVTRRVSNSRLKVPPKDKIHSARTLYSALHSNKRWPKRLGSWVLSKQTPLQLILTIRNLNFNPRRKALQEDLNLALLNNRIEAPALASGWLRNLAPDSNNLGIWNHHYRIRPLQLKNPTRLKVFCRGHRVAIKSLLLSLPLLLKKVRLLNWTMR